MHLSRTHGERLPPPSAQFLKVKAGLSMKRPRLPIPRYPKIVPGYISWRRSRPFLFYKYQNAYVSNAWRRLCLSSSVKSRPPQSMSRSVSAKQTFNIGRCVPGRLRKSSHYHLANRNLKKPAQTRIMSLRSSPNPKACSRFRMFFCGKKNTTSRLP